MSELLKIKNRSKLISDKKKIALEELLEMWNKKEIINITELQYMYNKKIEKIYEDFGKAKLEKREARYRPVVEDYNNTIIEAREDISTAYSEVNKIEEEINKSFEKVEFERKLIQSQLIEIENEINKIHKKNNLELDEIIFNEYFNDENKFDKELVKGKKCKVHMTEQVLTLDVIEKNNLIKDGKVSIVNGDGILGNSHEVRNVGGKYKFYGEENLRADLKNIIDENHDSWIEYEMINVKKSDIDELGEFKYREEKKWADSGIKEVNLELEIELGKKEIINWISINPYISRQNGISYLNVNNIIVSNGYGNYNEIINGIEKISSESVYIFPKQECLKVNILLSENTGYLSKIGKLVFRENKKEVSYLDKENVIDGKVVEGILPSIESLGYNYNSSNKSIDAPKNINNTSIFDYEKSKNHLFGIPVIDDIITGSFEYIDARRYSIGIRDINICYIRFDTESVYISKPFKSINKIKEISLEVDYINPFENDYLRYFISIDNGNKWYEINSLDNKGPGKQKIIINENISGDKKEEYIEYIDLNKDVKEVRVKIEMKRKTNIENSSYYSPVVKGYSVICKTIE